MRVGTKRHQRLLREFVTDRTSGAAELARTAGSLVAEAERARLPADRMAQLRARLAAAHPTMAAVWNTVHAEDPAAYLDDAERGQGRAVRAARRQLRRRARVVTLSYSSTVAQVLARRDLRVSVAESRPGDDGRHFARRRAARGLHTDVIPDATLAVAVLRADCALIGADAVTRRFVINKVGSRLLALACRDAGIPLYVVADPSKRAPVSWPVPEYSRQRPFEAVPRRLVTAVFDGVEPT